VDDEVDHEVDEMEFSGRTIVLHEPASQELELNGPNGLLLAWEPKDKQALELEVRARIVTIFAPDTESIPQVFWHMEIGHGDDQAREPILSLLTSIRAFSLPARGMIWRTAARNFRIEFSNVGYIGAPAQALKSIVQVSILPTYGTHINVAPYVLRNALSANFSEIHLFPITAREFKMTTNTGVPVPAATIQIQLKGITNADVGAIVDAAVYAEWTPVPHDAAGFLTDADVYTAYR